LAGKRIRVKDIRQGRQLPQLPCIKPHSECVACQDIFKQGYCRHTRPYERGQSQNVSFTVGDLLKTLRMGWW